MTNEGICPGLRTFCAAAMAMAMGCAGLGSVNKRSPGQVVDGQFKPALPPEANYGPDPALTCPEHGVNGAVEFLLKQEDLKGKKLLPDGRLCALAETMLGWQSADNELPSEIVRAFLSQYFGLAGVMQPGNLLLQEVELDSSKSTEIGSGLVSTLVQFAETAKAPRYGLITERISATNTRNGMAAGKTRIRMVMYDEQVVLDPPLPRALPAGGSATLSGHIDGDVKNLKIQVVDTVGKLTTTPGQGLAFSVPIACGDHPGKVLVQIGGESDSGDVQLANFPVVCGGELAAAAPAPGKDTGPIDPATAEKKISDAINGDRTTAGIKALNVSAPLSEIARALAEKQAAGKGVSSSDLTQMMKEKDVTAPMISESAARAFNADEAYSKLSDSPSDRANEMSPDMTDLGVGVSKGTEVGGKMTIIATVLYIKQLPPPDPVATKAKLYQAIDTKRAGARADPVKKDETLDAVAQSYADAAAKAGAPLAKDKESEILAPLYKQSMTVNELGGWTRDETNALEVAEQGSVIGQAKLVGVGIATGTSVQFGKNSLFVMVLLGARHEAAKPVRKAPAKKH